MNRRTLSLGFIGGGWNSAVGATHVIAARMDGQFSVDAGAFSRYADTNRQTAQRWGVAEARVYDSFDRLLEQEVGRLDAIVVLTPTPDHVDPVLKALGRGYPVICEKALAASTDDARRIAQAVDDSHGFLAVTYNYTGYPMLRELRRLLLDGRLGRITQIHVEMPQEGFAKVGAGGAPVVPQSWRLHDGSIPTISLDLGVHVHHLVHFLTGEHTQEVMAMHGSHGNFEGLVDNVMCMARYTGDLDASFWFSKSALGHRNGLRLRVYGRNGSAEWFQMEPEQLLLHDARGQRTILDRASVDATLAAELRYNRFKAGHPAGFIEAFANLYDDIASSLHAHLAGRQAPSDFVFTARDALDGLVTLEAMATSARTRSWTAVPAANGTGAGK
ncbi:MAG: Gfo/Idh/MocA family oxidoreductase [Moraxellaceae bacterium]|jgi:predicted dehydrogenase|nr:Gfo/Idh/MocA family oxidoreductase [Moraxellaceae bacterium]